MNEMTTSQIDQIESPNVKPVKTPKESKIILFLQSIQNRLFALKSKYLIFCFLVPVALMYLIYLSMEIHPFGNGSVLVLDLNGQYVYFFESLRNTVMGEGSFFYTFFRALGGEYMGMYAYYLASPLSYIVCLFPQNGILEALLAMILIKVGLCGVTFGYYLHKNSKAPNKLMIIAFSVMYSLCAYAVVHQNNIMWIDALIWLPLLTLGLEHLVKFGKYKLFIISLALTIMSNYYNGYMVCIYTVAYFLYYMLANSPAQKNPLNIKHHSIISTARIISAVAIAAAISAFIIVAAYYSLTFGKDTFSNPTWSATAKFDILDFFTKLLPGSYDTVRPEGLPFVYCGVLTLLMIPVYFVSRAISTREKLASAALIGFFVISFILKPLDLIWHGFSAPNWLNYRYSFMLCFIMLALAYKGLGNLKKVGEKFLFGIAACIILFVAIAQKMTFDTYKEVSDGKLDTFRVVWLSIIVVLVLLGALLAFIKASDKKKHIAVSSVLLGVICIEIFCSSLTCVVMFDDDVVYSSYNGYNNYLGNIRPIVNEIKDDDTSFYRMETLDHRKYNDNMALGMRGLTNSTSTLNSETITFLGEMGYVSRSHLSKYLGGNPVNDSLLGIKYVIEKIPQSTSEEEKQTPLDKTSVLYNEKYKKGIYKAYENPYAMSLAYGVNEDISGFEFDSYETYFEALNALVSTMNGNEEIAQIFVPVKTTRAMSGVESNRSASKTSYVTREGSNGKLTFRFKTSYSGEYYFHTPSTSYKEVDISVNGSVGKDDWLGSNTRHIYPLGYFEEGEYVSIDLELTNKSMSITNNIDCVWYLDKAVFEEEFENLANGPQLDINDNFKEDCITGSITTTESEQTILTSIPYDRGWKVFVDGKEIDTDKSLRALISFTIDDAGEHSIEIKYAPTIYKLGFIISALGTLGFISLCVIEFVIKKKKLAMGIVPETVNDLKWVLEDFELEQLEEPPNNTVEAIEIPDEQEASEVIETTENDDNQGEN